MRSSSGLSLLVAFGFGAAVGVAAAATEALAPGTTVPLEGFAAYALIGGGTTILGRLVLGRFGDRTGGPRAAALTLITFASAEILYVVNVRALPGEYYLSTRSLLFDAVGLSWPLAGAIALLRVRSVHEARQRWERPLAFSSALAVLLTLSVLLQGDSSAVAARTATGAGPNLLLVVLDSVRRDHLGTYGYGARTSPALDAIAARARVYDAAYAAAPWTVPSVAQLMTGRTDLTRPDLTLAEALTARGYTTACFTDNPHLDRASPVMRGFRVVSRSVGRWRWTLRGTVLGSVVERLAPGRDRDLVDRAARWAEGTPGPVFVYAHLMDSHTPYRWPSLDGQRHRGRRIEFPISGMPLTSDEAADIVGRYDGGVRSAADQAARLIQAAEGWGRPYVAIVTADHGESLGEEGRWFHGGSLAPELLAVPLFVTGAGVTPGRVSTPVGHEAVRLTLLAAAAAAGGDVADLRTAAPTGEVEGGLPPDLAYRVADQFMVIVNRRTGARQLFRTDDARRAIDLAAAKPEIVRVLAEGLVPGGKPEPPLAEVRERLRAIGYVDFD